MASVPAKPTRASPTWTKPLTNYSVLRRSLLFLRTLAFRAGLISDPLYQPRALVLSMPIGIPIGVGEGTRRRFSRPVCSALFGESVRTEPPVFCCHWTHPFRKNPSKMSDLYFQVVLCAIIITNRRAAVKPFCTLWSYKKTLKFLQISTFNSLYVLV